MHQPDLCQDDTWFDTSGSDDDGLRGRWDNVDKVSFCFIETGKSKWPGILVTHDMNYRFTKTGTNGKDRIWWRCGEYENCKCEARATTIYKKVMIDRDDGSQSEEVTFQVIAISCPDDHRCKPDPAPQIAGYLMTLMSQQATSNLEKKVGEC